MAYDSTDFMVPEPSRAEDIEAPAKTNLRKVRDLIASLSDEQFDMGAYAEEEPCGTVACIAGWACIVAGVGNIHSLVGDDIHERAQRHLGLTTQAATNLFTPFPGYSADYQFAWLQTPDRKQAVRVLDHLLETGEVDWPRALADGGEAVTSGNSGLTS